jgi:hypothetical protein
MKVLQPLKCQTTSNFEEKEEQEAKGGKFTLRPFFIDNLGG